MTLVCVASVLADLPADAELIVVDDASTDGTAERIRDAIVLRQPINRGFASSVNAGVAASRGEVILLLNSDTRIVPGTLAAFLMAFEEDAQLGVAGAQLINVDGSPQWSAGPVPTMLWMVVAVSGIARFLRPFRRRKRVGGDVGWVSGAAMAFRRRVWDAAGPLREDFRFYAQDLDFCVRARRAGWNVRLLSHIRVEHRLGATIGSAPDLLWLDLLTWGRGEYGDAWARRARRAMIVAAAVRSVFSREYKRGYDALRRSPS